MKSMQLSALAYEKYHALSSVSSSSTSNSAHQRYDSLVNDGNRRYIREAEQAKGAKGNGVISESAASFAPAAISSAAAHLG